MSSSNSGAWGGVGGGWAWARAMSCCMGSAATVILLSMNQTESANFVFVLCPLLPEYSTSDYINGL